MFLFWESSLDPERYPPWWGAKTVTEADIYWAFDHFLYEKSVPEAPDKYLMLSFDRNANLLEIVYNRINEDTIKVFHVA
ncbi:hypothetical protein ACYULU_02755 [Breznakiellaceae bacterium SP9]